SFFFSIVLFFVVALQKGQQMKLNKRLFGPCECLLICASASQQHNPRDNSRRVKDTVSQPNKRLGQVVSE
ncbi:MAG TPA: hypothetical protein VNO50_07415, partial [Pyrinomonadaceae bacterium]|nr:hypothetical protein [Pyrinomonadaceae bacterium]